MSELAVAYVRMGRNSEADEAISTALELLEAQPESRQLGMAYATQAYLRMLDRDNTEAARSGATRRRCSPGGASRTLETTARAKNAVGPSQWMLLSGDERGRTYLEEPLDLRCSAEFGDQVALAYAT